MDRGADRKGSSPEVAAARTMKGRARRAAQAAAASLEAARRRSAIVDTLAEAHVADRAAHGSMFAGALAFRLFLLLLPMTLLSAAWLGFLAASGTSPQEALRSAGVTGLSVTTIGDALSRSPASRWWALGVGLVGLVFGSFSVAKVVHQVHAVAWGDPEARLRPTPWVFAAVVISAVGAVLFAWIGSRIRDFSVPGLLLPLGLIGMFAALWLALELCLPHGEAPWTRLVPGALILGVGFESLHYLTVVWFARELSRASDLYGALGSALIMLSYLYLLGRLIVAAAVFNATLWSRHRRGLPLWGRMGGGGRSS